MDFVNLIDLISNNGISIVLIAYMIVKDWLFTKDINNMLIQMKDTLDIIKETAEEKEAILTVLEQLNEKLNKE